VEINTWGGFLKQYEIAINSSSLKAMNIEVGEVFRALENNNSIAGGAYIEKENQSYFIRGEGKVNSIQDIENIVVKNDNGIPVYIKNVAKVRYGSANRFGAITANGEGEKVLGQVMMLKGANSKQVIEEVTNRVAEIQKTLPEGVYINGFLERSELVGKTTFTVAENLILGCLIVIFVVVLLLGNWRSGLVVASVIPLCLLFAISFMNLLGIDANLMSLGAIDFGIIIDGAVIIVEFIAFQITQKSAELKQLSGENQQSEIDRITLKSASKMMNSAIFGQLIILIVFIPILSLTGVEGKMFKPMAMTFSFALIGAMLLCFTYVPVVSSLFLKPKEEKRIILFIDLKDSTPIAEKLGHKKYFFFIRDFIHHISLALLEYDGLIYQYVGDEVVLTWNIKHGLENANCLKTFFMFKENLISKSDHYLKTYGVVPKFKAGMHLGNVVCAQIGDTKRQIVYNGDVVNTASRIQDQCKKYQRDCLVSGDLFKQLRNYNGLTWERVDTVALRGKENAVELYSVTAAL